MLGVVYSAISLWAFFTWQGIIPTLIIMFAFLAAILFDCGTGLCMIILYILSYFAIYHLFGTSVMVLFMFLTIYYVVIKSLYNGHDILV